EPGVTPATDVVLSWPTFTAAADQAGRARRYGGIHFRDGDLVGRALGGMVGARAWEAAAELFAGRLPTPV
ncbi:MAG TPA: phosphoesterase, partial [Actinomycetes bacterium]|nr:phosphoesterase [Actinomycetes bacterium]